MKDLNIYIEAEQPADQRPASVQRVFARFWFKWPGQEPFCSGAAMFDLRTWEWLVALLKERAEVEIDMVVEEDLDVH